KLIAVDPRGEIGDRADAKQHAGFGVLEAQAYSIAGVSPTSSAVWHLETLAGVCDDADMTTRTASIAGSYLELVERAPALALEPVTNRPGYRSMRTKPAAMLTSDAK